jgi:hypothetical protein
MIEIVYAGLPNTITKTWYRNSEPLPFSAVTRMTLRVGGVLLDSDDDASVIDWSQGGGQVTFNFAPAALPIGLHQAVLMVYDAAHPLGQVLAHPAGPKLTFRVVR